MDVRWLISPEGRRVVEQVRGLDALRARAAVPDVDPARLADALTQVAHRPDHYPLALVTADGVQQASPQQVAERRARRLAETQSRCVIDAGCGIGMDAWALARAGLDVLAFEADPNTAEVARANLTGLDVEVRNADVTTADLPADCALYVDPARRLRERDANGLPIRVHDPARWSPSWDWVLQQAEDRPVVARIRPGHRDLPREAEWHCSSIGRHLVDATVWFPPLAAAARRATVHAVDGWHEIAGDPVAPDAGPVAEFIVDPDPAIVRTGLVGNAAALCDGRLLDPHLAFFSCAAQPAAWLGRAMRVIEEVPLKRARAACLSLGMQRVTVWSRGLDRAPDLRLPHGRDGIVVVARLGARRVTRVWIGVPVS